MIIPFETYLLIIIQLLYTFAWLQEEVENSFNLWMY